LIIYAPNQFSKPLHALAGFRRVRLYAQWEQGKTALVFITNKCTFV